MRPAKAIQKPYIIKIFVIYGLVLLVAFILIVFWSYYNKLDFGTIPEWLASIGTILAVFAALWIATREAKTARRTELFSQSESISVWNRDIRPITYVVISNESKLPIYDVLISYGIAYGAGDPYLKGNENQVFLLKVPPGKYMVEEPHNPGGGMHSQLGISISFRDCRGNFWRRDASGKLAQTKNHPFKEMDIIEPVSNWSRMSFYR